MSRSHFSQDSPSRPVEVCIGLGGNIAPIRHFECGLERLAAYCRLKALSALYWTPAIGRPEQPDYLNAALLVETRHSPQDLKWGVLAGIEAAEGRARSADAYAMRTLDLDILLYADWVLSEGGVRIPDPDIAERDFLQASLLELLPAISSRSMAVLLRAQLPPTATRSAYRHLKKDAALTQQLYERFGL